MNSKSEGEPARVKRKKRKGHKSSVWENLKGKVNQKRLGRACIGKMAGKKITQNRERGREELAPKPGEKAEPKREKAELLGKKCEQEKGKKKGRKRKKKSNG